MSDTPTISVTPPSADGGNVYPKSFSEDRGGSRNKILLAVKNNQPAFSPLPQLINYPQAFTDVVANYKTVLQAIGGHVQEVSSIAEIINILKVQFKEAERIVTVADEFSPYAKAYQPENPHLLEDVDVAIIKAHFAVAENGAIWVTDDIIKERVLPFICQHLVAVINAADIVASMHDAYDKIGGADYGFGGFIAGPSKTADIEQSLVLGAHGPRTMTVFIMK